MNAKTLAKLLAFSSAAICLGTTPGLSDGQHCEHVGGGVLTNFLSAADCAASPVQLCTDGPATGDLRGAVGVTVLAVKGIRNGTRESDFPHRHFFALRALIDRREAANGKDCLDIPPRREVGIGLSSFS